MRILYEHYVGILPPWSIAIFIVVWLLIITPICFYKLGFDDQVIRLRDLLGLFTIASAALPVFLIIFVGVFVYPAEDGAFARKEVYALIDDDYTLTGFISEYELKKQIGDIYILISKGDAEDDKD